jgi:hypothetical protein
MASLAVPSFHSPALWAQRPTPVVVTEAAAWRGILAVEPDVSILNAKSLLLTQANYCVTRASSDRDLLSLRGTKTVALAILSDRLGPRLLGSVAEIVRRHWPRTRILVLGQVPPLLEDHLYDEHICRASDSRQTLANLENLYKGMWNQRSNAIDWSAGSSAQHFAPPPRTP